MISLITPTVGRSLVRLLVPYSNASKRARAPNSLPRRSFQRSPSEPQKRTDEMERHAQMIRDSCVVYP